MAHYFEQAKFISLGGATEAAIWSIYYPIDINTTYKNSIPYGKPLANQYFYVLNKELELCPDWTIGDLYIGERGLPLATYRMKKYYSEIYCPSLHWRTFICNWRYREIPTRWCD